MGEKRINKDFLKVEAKGRVLGEAMEFGGEDGNCRSAVQDS